MSVPLPDLESIRNLIRLAYAAGYEAGAYRYSTEDQESMIYRDDMEPSITEYVALQERMGMLKI